MRNIILLFLISCLLNSWNQPLKDSVNHRVSEILTKFSPSSFFSTINRQEKPIPKVKLNLSQNENLTWGSFVQYTIEVSDKADGDSKYGEILNHKVVLEIEFIPFNDKPGLNQNIPTNEKQPNHEGLSLMMESTCFACHADKEIMTGPSFSEIAKRYEKTQNNIALLANHILEGSMGQWDNVEMPSHPNLTVEETEKIAAFILSQGSKKNHRILAGLEGMFQIMEKPSDLEQGVYLLTASYTSSSSIKGQQSITLQIK